MCKLGDVLSKLLQLKPNANGGLEAKTPAAVRFFVKTSYFNATGLNSHVFRAFWTN